MAQAMDLLKSILVVSLQEQDLLTRFGDGRLTETAAVGGFIPFLMATRLPGGGSTPQRGPAAIPDFEKDFCLGVRKFGLASRGVLLYPSASPMNKILLVLLAILLPPLAVYLKTQSAKDTVINVILCLIFWLPAVLHALWVVLK